ncbi:unnamed protein product [Brassica rapa subsp. narinosa]
MKGKSFLLGPSHAKGIVHQKTLSSLTLSSVSVLEYNLSRTERRLCCDQFTKRGLFFISEGHVVGDIPGVRYKVVKVSDVSISTLYKGKEQLKS